MTPDTSGTAPANRPAAAAVPGGDRVPVPGLVPDGASDGGELVPRFPSGVPLPVGALLAELEREPCDGPLTVGDERITAFLSAVGRRLLSPAVARAHPELGSLGFFLRRAEIARAVDRLRGEHLRVPRGLVFHIPPANVDTVFVYSWALSALAGNRNVVRLSRRAGGAAPAVLEALESGLSGAHPAVAQTQRIVSYERSDAVTARLSAACDLRIIWGGDRAVTDIRRHPLAPHARDLTFPDRSSLAVVSTAAWLDAPERVRQAAAEAFAADVYWFDQAACSSPRTVFWIGEAEATARARDDFAARLAATAARRWPVDAAMAVQKRVGAYGAAADGTVRALAFHGNALTLLDLADPADPPRHWLGTGTLGHARLGSLAELAGVVRRGDQTLSAFGFDRAELEGLARTLAGRGIDRIVPFGQALTFHPVWDGVDLLHECTRLVTISG
ncbi:acyl-CoA reductase [Streptosporangium fragile]|uniref:Acyl-CoA reductase n=1 Tax=Streptosporangium fragile TaxID=46186 RepID=A0ABN3W5L4_9ACTN